MTDTPFSMKTERGITIEIVDSWPVFGRDTAALQMWAGDGMMLHQHLTTDEMVELATLLMTWAADHRER